MKKDLHPTDYRFVVFQDESAKFSFLTQSTAGSNETVKWEDGQEYPLIKIHVSSASHPFYTGEKKVLDIEGRVDKFEARRKTAAARKDAIMGKAKKTAVRAAQRAKKPNAGDDAKAVKDVKKTQPQAQKKVPSTKSQ